MKKIILASTLLATIGIGAASVYAGSPADEEFNSNYGHMMDNEINRGVSNKEREIFIEARHDRRDAYREEQIQLALAEGWITEDEAAERRAEFAERDRLYEENGFESDRYRHRGSHRRYRQYNGYGCH